MKIGRVRVKRVVKIILRRFRLVSRFRIRVTIVVSMRLFGLLQDRFEWSRNRDFGIGNRGHHRRRSDRSVFCAGRLHIGSIWTVLRHGKIEIGKHGRQTIPRSILNLKRLHDCTHRIQLFPKPRSQDPSVRYSNMSSMRRRNNKATAVVKSWKTDCSVVQSCKDTRE